MYLKNKFILSKKLVGRINPISQLTKDICLFKMPKSFSEWRFHVVLQADYSEGTTTKKEFKYSMALEAKGDTHGKMENIVSIIIKVSYI